MFCFNELNVMLTWNIIHKGFQQGSPISQALFAGRPKGFEVDLLLPVVTLSCPEWPPSKAHRCPPNKISCLRGLLLWKRLTVGKRFGDSWGAKMFLSQTWMCFEYVKAIRCLCAPPAGSQRSCSFTLWFLEAHAIYPFWLKQHCGTFDPVIIMLH